MKGNNQRVIASRISRKMNAWLNTVDDEDLRKSMDSDIIVTGGCITSMLLGEPVNDFDVYFSTFKTAEKVANYYAERMTDRMKSRVRPVHVTVAKTQDQAGKPRINIKVQSSGVYAEQDKDAPAYEYFEHREESQAGEYLDSLVGSMDAAEADVDASDKDAKPMGASDPYRPVFASTNAITLADDVQIVFRFWGDPDEIHKNYDFVHCTNYWTRSRGLRLNTNALAATLSRELRYVGSLYPICSIFRTRKFIERGWTVTAGQMLKMAWQVSELDLNNYEVLHDQLNGVDVAYFQEILEKLREKDPAKVDSAYLYQLIDRIM